MKEKKAIMTTQLPTNTSDASDKRAHIKRLAALINDKAHIHRQALRLAGAYLQGAEKEIIEAEIALLDDASLEDRELYDVQLTLISTIAKEVVQIGRDLVKMGS